MDSLRRYSGCIHYGTAELIAQVLQVVAVVVEQDIAGIAVVDMAVDTVAAGIVEVVADIVGFAVHMVAGIVVVGIVDIVEAVADIVDTVAAGIVAVVGIVGTAEVVGIVVDIAVVVVGVVIVADFAVEYQTCQVNYLLLMSNQLV